MGLKDYHRKRDFKKTPEPEGSSRPRSSRRKLSYVIQKHAATRLHYDFRLELEGVLKSWAVPKGPSLDPRQKRLAVHVEDHPIEYGKFEGVIPKGEYGGGTVLLWDRGIWIPEGDPVASYRRGRMEFTLEGEKLHGSWALIRMEGERGEDGKNWLLFKRQDEYARPRSDITQEMPLSVAGGRSLDQIAAVPGKVWRSNRSENVRDRAKAGSTGSRPVSRSAPILDLASLPGARRGALPREPPGVEMATLVSEIPSGDEWLHEIKYDGYRMLAVLSSGRARLVTRNRKDWSERFPALIGTIEAWPVKSVILDGEVVALDEKGISSFQKLQNALSDGAGSDVVYFVFDILHLDGWDLTGVPLESRKAALQKCLSEMAGVDDRVRYSDHIIGRGEEFYRQACRLGLEGLVSKLRQTPYRPGRHKDWLKTKCLQRQELVIGGYTDPEGSRSGLGALLLGYYDDRRALVYAGRVGTGFTQRSLEEIHERLRKLEQKTPPFTNPPKGRGLHWVKPKLVAEVEFQEWTREGSLRHPRFRGLREDKPPMDVRRESPLRDEERVSGAGKTGKSGAEKSKSDAGKTGKPGAEKSKSDAGKTGKSGAEKSKSDARKTGKAKASRASARGRSRSPKTRRSDARTSQSTQAGSRSSPDQGSSRANTLSGVPLTHPERVLYEEEGITKVELARYYEEVAPLMIPHLRRRPLMLLRCPRGQGKPCFIQKHAGDSVPPRVLQVRIEESGGPATGLAIEDASGLVSLVQMGALEVHTWGSTVDRIENPVVMIFDLDPDPSVEWERVLAAATSIRDRLSDLGLRSFVKTTGGKGLHVTVPLQPRASWEQVREFSRALAGTFVRERPLEYTIELSKARRSGRILIDWMRNGRGATAIAPYSSRARPGAPVATPVRWEELTRTLRPEAFTVRSLPPRIEKLSKDPWEDYASVRQSLTQVMLRNVSASS